MDAHALGQMADEGCPHHSEHTQEDDLRQALMHAQTLDEVGRLLGLED